MRNDEFCRLRLSGLSPLSRKRQIRYSLHAAADKGTTGCRPMIQPGTEADVFGILHRMILWELTKVFLMSLVGITGILLMAGIVAEASQQGLSPAQILKAIPLLIPSTLPYTIPATTLFATCVVYGRLAADNEILAIKAAGINLFTVVWPGLLLGIVMSGVTMGLYYRIIPYTHRLLREMVYNDAEELLYSMLARQKSVSHSSMPFSIWVRGVQGHKLIDVLIRRRNPNDPNQIDVAQAKEAELTVDAENKLLIVRMTSTTTTGADGAHFYFPQHPWILELPDGFLKNAENRRARDMSWQEILDARRELDAKVEQENGEVALATSKVLQEARRLICTKTSRIINAKWRSCSSSGCCWMSNC